MLWLNTRVASRWPRWWVVVRVTAIIAGWSALPCNLGLGDPPSLDRNLRHIDELVRKLGDDEYAVRERAERELSGLGLAALDALSSAQFDDDVEIAVRARRLLRSIQVRWVSDRDPKQVRQVLSGYGELPSGRRRDVIDRLARLPNSAGLVAVARVARYEPSLQTAKYAALTLLKAPAPVGPHRNRITQDIALLLGGSSRESVVWARAAVRIWRSPQTKLAEWDKIVDREESTFAIHPEQSERALLRQLLFAHAEVLLAAAKPDQARKIAARFVPLIDDDRAQLMEAADWLLTHEWYDLMESLYQRFHDGFRQNTVLMFRLAEARRQAGKMESANEAAETAAHTASLNGPKALWLLGMSLQNDGYFHWAELVYRKVIDVEDPQWSEIAPVCVTTAEMLHDLRRDGEAAEVLQRLVHAGRDKRMRSVIERETRQPMEILAARAAFFEACDLERKGNHAAQYEALQRALTFAPQDADVLISLYRASRPFPDKLAIARKQIADAVTYYRDRIEAMKQQINRSGSNAERTRAELQVAQDCNQVAWLIANTEGNVRWAIECSREALAIYPDSAGFRDTLARCYFANGDLDRAIAEQQAAVKAEPHSPSLQAQLDEFLAAKRRTTDSPREQ